MTSDISPQAQDSSSSRPAANSVRSNALLQLGQKIVTELGLDDSADTLARWMAHYVAELIQDAETAAAEERDASRARCSDAILALWKHRHEFPDGKPPFKDFEPILRTLEALDPSDSRPYYFRHLRKDAEESDLDPETKSWLEMAEGLDYTARILISECLAQAAKKAGEKSRDWGKLAECAGVSDDVDLVIYDLINKKTDLSVSSEPDDESQKLLEDRLKRLEAFREIAATLESDLRRRLKSGSDSA